MRQVQNTIIYLVYADFLEGTLQGFEVVDKLVFKS